MTASTTPIARRLLLALLALVAMPTAWAFGLDEVAMRANSLASKAYQPPVINMPAALRDLDYDGYRDIRFRPEKALWRTDKLPFELMFFHQGRTVPEPVRINIVDPSGSREVPFDPALFDYGKNKFDPQTLRGLGFNGFRVHYRGQQAGLQGRGARVPGRQLLPAPSARDSCMACRLAVSPSTRPPPRARSSRASSSSGSSDRVPARPRSRSTACSIPSGSRARTVSS